MAVTSLLKSCALAGHNVLTSKSPLWLITTAPHTAIWAGPGQIAYRSSTNRVDKPSSMPHRNKTVPILEAYDWLAASHSALLLLQLEAELIGACSHPHASPLHSHSYLNSTLPDSLLTHAALTVSQTLQLSYAHIYDQLTSPIDVSADIHRILGQASAHSPQWVVSLEIQWEKYKQPKVTVALRSPQASSHLLRVAAIVHPRPRMANGLGSLYLTPDRFFTACPTLSKHHDDLIAIVQQALSSKNITLNTHPNSPTLNIDVHYH